MVHILGLDVDNPGFGHDILGDIESQKRGRVATAIRIALDRLRLGFRVLLSIGTGATHWQRHSDPANLNGFTSPDLPSGTPECTVIREFAHCNLSRLPGIAEWDAAPSLTLLRDARLDKSSTNTAEEVGLAMGACVDNGIDEVVFVSNPGHGPRVDILKSILADSSPKFDRLRGRIFVTTSEVPYFGSKVDNCCTVLEGGVNTMKQVRSGLPQLQPYGRKLLEIMFHDNLSLTEKKNCFDELDRVFSMYLETTPSGREA